MRKTGTTRRVRLCVRAGRMGACHEHIQTNGQFGAASTCAGAQVACRPAVTLVKVSRWPHGRRWQVGLGGRRPGHPATLAAGSRVG